MKLSAIDANLLLALHALLQERSVTRAGHRLGIGQPAMSRSLARLRDHFGDPLLVAKGRELVLTPMAVGLQVSVERAALALTEVRSGSACRKRPHDCRSRPPIPSMYSMRTSRCDAHRGPSH